MHFLTFSPYKVAYIKCKCTCNYKLYTGKSALPDKYERHSRWVHSYIYTISGKQNTVYVSTCVITNLNQNTPVVKK